MISQEKKFELKVYIRVFVDEHYAEDKLEVTTYDHQCDSVADAYLDVNRLCQFYDKHGYRVVDDHRESTCGAIHLAIAIEQMPEQASCHIGCRLISEEVFYKRGDLPKC